MQYRNWFAAIRYLFNHILLKNIYLPYCNVCKVHLVKIELMGVIVVLSLVRVLLGTTQNGVRS